MSADPETLAYRLVASSETLAAAARTGQLDADYLDELRDEIAALVEDDIGALFMLANLLPTILEGAEQPYEGFDFDAHARLLSTATTMEA